MNDEKECVAQEATSETTAQAQELAALKERYAYLLADFENHRRREERDRVQRTAAFQSAVVLDLLTLVDNFERAFNEAKSSDHADLQARLAGFELIYKSLLKLLEKYGVSEITEHATLDPELHEVLLRQPDPEKPAGSILAVFQKGYRMKGVVIRPAQVSVVAESVSAE